MNDTVGKRRDYENIQYVKTSSKQTPVVSDTKRTETFDMQQTFYNIAQEIADTLSRKNHDYGDSFAKIYEKYGDLSSLIRLTDKIGRLETLASGKEAKVLDEPLVDVYKDIAGYCILTLAIKLKLQGEF